MAACHPHTRSASSDLSSSNGSTGSSYQLILDHILTYPGSYEIPLRTMYTLNCAPRSQSSGSISVSSSSNGSSPMTAQAGFYDHQTTQTFAENLMAQMSKLPSQPTSLPPSFITSFVLRCFPAELTLVDFPQSLTGLDYLKDLETRRRREVAAALSRLAIDRTTLDLDASSLGERYPGVLQWVNSIEAKEKRVEALYTQVYVSLRRWILINELSLEPFNKHNCVAMLNTLYPPIISTPPTTRLTQATLKSQRDGFFKYITSVEKYGSRVLHNLMQQGKAEGESNGWMAVTRTLAMYLQLANSVISECHGIYDVQDVTPTQKRDSKESSRSVRKVDSGISFTGSDKRRPSTASSSGQEPLTTVETNQTSSTVGLKSSSTALEKLARGLKGMGRSRTDVAEMIAKAPTSPHKAEKPKSLRKMRSMGAMSSKPPKPEEVPTYDSEKMKRQRQKFDAMATTHSMNMLSFG
ncbi:Hypothetical protein R9X50_00298900 [Acrodontium crateriforme]|uniref:Uncharacterized protein n=1 Tax=Acrodontium crateriforme TaxID=150365 RepID=A0AAQ3R934_9PEZI|nr:Hypothetical protein R9X50_00298900 [Acrodontium crateriforme]